MKLNKTFTMIEMDDGSLLKFYERDVRCFKQGDGTSCFSVKVFSMDNREIGVLNMDSQRRMTSLYLNDGENQNFKWDSMISLDVNNGGKIVLTYETDRTVVSRVEQDGSVSRRYTISDEDFVTMLNWYNHQKRIGNTKLLF